MNKRGLKFIQTIKLTEERFMAQSDKDFLIMIIDSMIKGQKVSIKKIMNDVQ